MNNITDERFQVADEAICQSFLLVLKEKEYEKISVSDVIKKAGIVRSTFYNHYENIPDLVDSIEDKTIQDIFSLMEDFRPKNDWDICHSYFLSVCQYTMQNLFLSHLLLSPRGDAFFEKAMKMFHTYISGVTEKNTSSQHSRGEVSFMIASSIGSVIGVLHKWIAEKYQTPPETIADILTYAFISGVLPFLTHQSEPSGEGSSL